MEIIKHVFVEIVNSLTPKGWSVFLIIVLLYSIVAGVLIYLAMNFTKRYKTIERPEEIQGELISREEYEV